MGSLLVAAPNAALAQPGLVSTVGAYLAARAALFRSDPGTAAAYYRIVYDRSPGNPGLATTIINLWIEAGEVDRALPLARSAISAQPGNEPARMALAADAIRNGRFDDAAQHLDAIAGDSLSDATVGLLRAWVQAGEGDIDGALATLEGMDSSDLLQTFHAALIDDMAGRSEEALSLVSAVYQPNSSQRLTEAYARLLARNGQTEQAMSVIEDFLQSVPNHPSLTALLDDIRNGAEIGPLVSNAEEGAAEVFYGLGSSLVSSNDFDIAVNYLQLARYIGPASDLSSVLLGQVLQSQSRHDEAARVFDSVPGDSPFFTLAAIGASASDDANGLHERAAARLEPLAAAESDKRQCRQCACRHLPQSGALAGRQHATDDDAARPADDHRRRLAPVLSARHDLRTARAVAGGGS